MAVTFPFSGEWMDILDFGCGFKKYQGRPGIDNVVRIDRNGDFNPTKVFEMKPGAEIPYAENSFDMIVMRHVLEHMTDIPWCMREVWRVGRPDAKVKIWVPHASNIESHTDPTHRYHLTMRSMDYFDSTKQAHKYRYAGGTDFRILKAEPRFRDRIFGRVGQVLFPLLGALRYEKRCSWIAQIDEIYFELKIVK